MIESLSKIRYLITIITISKILIRSKYEFQPFLNSFLIVVKCFHWQLNYFYNYLSYNNRIMILINNK